jgi:Domain of unknown function (DUF6542)
MTESGWYRDDPPERGARQRYGLPDADPRPQGRDGAARRDSGALRRENGTAGRDGPAPRRENGAVRRDSRRPPPPPRRWGGLPKGIGVAIVIGFAALGALATAGANSEPGALLGAFVVAGTLVAGLAVKPRGVYLLIPAPILCYLIAAVMAGLIHDRATDTSSELLAVNATSWIGGGFVAMCIATGLAIVLTIARWPWRERRRGQGRDDDWSGDAEDRREPDRAARPQRRPSARNRTSALRD